MDPVYEPLHSGRQGAAIERIGQRSKNAGIDAGVSGLLYPQPKQLPAVPVSERGRAVFQIIRGILPFFLAETVKTLDSIVPKR